MACVQSNAQLEHTYGNIGAKRIQDTFVNKIIGNVEGTSADWASHLMEKKKKKWSRLLPQLVVTKVAVQKRMERVPIYKKNLSFPRKIL
ncbi:hypothetical protein [Candidatus Cardinium hertigii]|uniref:hypothetical protein n=1 Tax=Candidatus Cardinium TaxID=273135 RepID=UPI0034E03261